MSKFSLVLEPSGNKVKASSNFQKDGKDKVFMLGRHLLGLLVKDDGVVLAKGKELYSELPPPVIEFVYKNRETPKPEPIEDETTPVVAKAPKPRKKKAVKKAVKKAARRR